MRCNRNTFFYHHMPLLAAIEATPLDVRSTLDGATARYLRAPVSAWYVLGAIVGWCVVLSASVGALLSILFRATGKH